MVDVNVWLALSSDRHAHYQAAHQAAFCRLMQLACLRLLTNAQVMGPDVLSPRGFQRLPGVDAPILPTRV